MGSLHQAKSKSKTVFHTTRNNYPPIVIDESGVGSEYISVLPSSGILYLVKEIDYETINSFNLVVKVNRIH